MYPIATPAGEPSPGSGRPSVNTPLPATCNYVEEPIELVPIPTFPAVVTVNLSPEELANLARLPPLETVD